MSSSPPGSVSAACLFPARRFPARRETIPVPPRRIRCSRPSGKPLRPLNTQGISSQPRPRPQKFPERREFGTRSAPAREAQKGRGAAGGDRLLLVAGRRPVGGALAPVGGPRASHCELRMRGRVLQHPGQIVAIVGREPQFRALAASAPPAGPTSRSRRAGACGAAFSARDREQDEHPLRAIPAPAHRAAPCVVGKDADIAEVAPGDLGDQPGDAVLEHLAADKPDPGMRLGLRREVLAGAEPDLQPYQSGRRPRTAMPGRAPRFRAALPRVAAAAPAADAAAPAATAARAACRRFAAAARRRRSSAGMADPSRRGLAGGPALADDAPVGQIEPALASLGQRRIMGDQQQRRAEPGVLVEQ